MLSRLVSLGLFAPLVLANPVATLDENGLALQERQIVGEGPPCGQHNATNRGCWSGKWTVETDYELFTPPAFNTWEYDLYITNVTSYSDADGVGKMAMLINGGFPGPLIYAHWGDYIQINVHNELEDNGTSIHWHGLRMLEQNDQDGTNGITECPIPPLSSKSYAFRVTQYGTSWYHSHFSAQYGNGIVGAIQIDGPASDNYDIDLGPFVITDWYYNTADNLAREAELVSNGPPPDSDNILFNGTNVSADQTSGEYYKVVLTPGKKHRLRLINTSVDNSFTVSMVDHDFTVIAADFVPMEPTVKSSLFMAVGQRYDVIIDASEAVDNYWFNATLQTAGFCGTSLQSHPAAIMHYEGAPDANPTDEGASVSASCDDTTGFVPVVPRTLPAAEFDVTDKILDVVLDTPTTSLGTVFRWKVNGTDIDVEWDKPILDYVQENNNSWPHEANVIEVPDEDVWTWWVIENAGGLPHPIHLHGHDFSILGIGPDSFDPVIDVASLNFNNPTRRDVAQLPGGGWMVIAFKTDNPGAWLMHCHIAWHVSMGLSVQFLERKQDIDDILNLHQMNPNCDAWRSYWPNSYYPKTDSGLRRK